MKKISPTLLMCTALFALAGCPASEPPGGGASSEQAVMSSETESESDQQNQGTTVHRQSDGGKSPAGGAPMQGGPPAPGAPDPSKVEWAKQKYLPTGWPEFLPLPDDAEYQTREFDSDTGTGRLKFSTLMGGGKLKVTYRDNLKNNGYELDNLVPRKNSYLRKFKKGDRAIYVLVYDPKSKPNHSMVELRVTEDSGSSGSDSDDQSSQSGAQGAQSDQQSAEETSTDGNS